MRLPQFRFFKVTPISTFHFSYTPRSKITATTISPFLNLKPISTFHFFTLRGTPRGVTKAKKLPQFQGL